MGMVGDWCWTTMVMISSSFSGSTSRSGAIVLGCMSSTGPGSTAASAPPCPIPYAASPSPSPSTGRMEGCCLSPGAGGRAGLRRSLPCLSLGMGAKMCATGSRRVWVRRKAV